jgi:hypothetical protein
VTKLLSKKSLGEIVFSNLLISQIVAKRNDWNQDIRPRLKEVYKTPFIIKLHNKNYEKGNGTG